MNSDRFGGHAAGNRLAGQTCSLARTLEVVGERWTLLIVRDLFFGVRRFNDLQRHLDIPRAMLAARLAALVEAGIVEPDRAGSRSAARSPARRPRADAVGRAHHSPGGPRRLFLHTECGAELDAGGLPGVRTRRARTRS